MDSITHALYRAITAQNAAQKAAETIEHRKVTAGLQALAIRPSVHQAYLGAAGTDLHIALGACDELLALQMEFIAAGYSPPATMATDGAEVIISPGRVDVMAGTDDGNGSWTAILAKKDPQHRGDRRAIWEEQ
jgi:hypothetical protein